MRVSEIMKASRLKVKRAYRHIDTLIAESSPLSKALYEITNGPGRSIALLAQLDGFYLTYRPKEPITEHFGSIMGDVVNNLRESLDYWMNSSIRAVGATRKVHFPFSEKWKDLKTSPNYPTVKKAFPDAAKFILEEVKPCRDTNLHLWAVASLCNFNKHNDFLPVVSVVNVNNINARIGTNVLQNVAMSGDANRPLNMIRSDTPIAIENNFSTSVEITFPKGAVFEDQSVVPTLLNAAEVVSKTLDALESFIRPYAK